MTRPALIFDLDGTLSDPRHGILRCVRHALAALGREEPSIADLERCIGPPLTDALAAVLGGHGDVAEAVRLFRECYSGSGLFENELYPGILDALRTLRGLAPRMLIATSKPHTFANRIIERFELNVYFDAIYGCELDGQRSDKRELIAHLLSREEMTDAVLIGDRKHDVEAALANGIGSIGVTWGFGSLDELTTAGAHRIIGSVAELVEWYRSGGSSGPRVLGSSGDMAAGESRGTEEPRTRGPV